MVSGINDGSNVGRDSLLSGTVGAAAAAAMMGIPSIAMSQARRTRPSRYGPSKIVLPAIARLAVEDPSLRGLIISANAPYCRPDEIRGVVRVEPADMHVFRRTTFDGEEPGANGMTKVESGIPADGLEWQGRHRYLGSEPEVRDSRAPQAGVGT